MDTKTSEKRPASKAKFLLFGAIGLMFVGHGVQDALDFSVPFIVPALLIACSLAACFIEEKILDKKYGAQERSGSGGSSLGGDPSGALQSMDRAASTQFIGVPVQRHRY